MKRQYRDLFMQIWFYDDKKLRNEMILKYLDKVKSYIISFGDYLDDELTSDAYIILDKVISNYLYSRNPSFDLFLEKEVKKILTNQLEENRNFISYNDLIHTETYNSLLDDYIISEDNKLVFKLLNILSPIERMVIELFFGFYDGICYKIEEISKTLRIKETEVSRILHSCIDEFREFVTNKNSSKFK